LQYTSNNPLFEAKRLPSAFHVTTRLLDNYTSWIASIHGRFMPCIDASIPVPSVGSALGCWVREGLGLVVHIPSGCVAKINIPWPWPWIRWLRQPPPCLWPQGLASLFCTARNLSPISAKWDKITSDHCRVLLWSLPPPMTVTRSLWRSQNICSKVQQHQMIHHQSKSSESFSQHTFFDNLIPLYLDTVDTLTPQIRWSSVNILIALPGDDTFIP
jgi:hypothetical protein